MCWKLFMKIFAGSFACCKSLLRFAAVFFLLSLQISCSEEDLGNVPELSEHARQADYFVQETIKRIAESWESVAMEFRLAFQHIGDQPVYLQRDLEAKASITAEKLIDHTVDSLEEQVEQVKQQVYDAAEETLEEQKDIMDGQFEQMKEQILHSRDSVREKTEQLSDTISEKVRPEDD